MKPQPGSPSGMQQVQLQQTNYQFGAHGNRKVENMKNEQTLRHHQRHLKQMLLKQAAQSLES